MPRRSTVSVRCGPYGQRLERKARLLDQLELELKELEAGAPEDELAAEMAAQVTPVQAFTRKKPSREGRSRRHLPRERVVIPGPTSCDCCGSDKHARLGELELEGGAASQSRIVAVFAAGLR